jgi:hypothetical protein
MRQALVQLNILDSPSKNFPCAAFEPDKITCFNVKLELQLVHEKLNLATKPPVNVK